MVKEEWNRIIEIQSDQMNHREMKFNFNLFKCETVDLTTLSCDVGIGYNNICVEFSTGDDDGYFSYKVIGSDEVTTFDYPETSLSVGEKQSSCHSLINRVEVKSTNSNDGWNGNVRFYRQSTGQNIQFYCTDCSVVSSTDDLVKFFEIHATNNGRGVNRCSGSCTFKLIE